MAYLFANNWPLTNPEPENTGSDVYDLDHFQNKLPPESTTKYIPLTRPPNQDIDATSSVSVSTPESRWKTLFWPAVAITIPIALLSATLLALVFGYRVRSQPNIFQPGPNDYDPEHSAYLLVNYSATRLVFAASFLSTVAPLLASFVMTLWSLIASANMRLASNSSRFEQLPTPYQLSLLVGLCLASMEQLRTYLVYLASRKRRTTLPAVLNRSAFMFVLTICLASAVFLADTALHYSTSTIVFDQIATITQPTQEFGRGLSALCLDLDRVKDNYGFPCSMNVGDTFEDPNRTAKRNEMNRLQSNTSSVSQIRLTSPENFADHVAIVIPQPETLAPGVDYRASTIGVSTQCRLVPPAACNMTALGNSNTFTQFNCSENYFGVLGKSPNISTSNGQKAIDPDLSPLAFKPAINLDWAFFTDSNLTTLYNPESWDPSTDQPDATHIIPDDQLINPFYLGLATRISINSFTVNNTITTEEPNVFNSKSGYLDLILSCQITSHSVNYTWYKSSVQNVSLASSGNGSLLEIFHGTQQYSTVTGGGFDLQQYLVDASIAGNDTESFVSTWADLYSVKVLSLVGAYLTPRTNLQEQTREALLVAKVPKPALGALVACSLVYTVIGISLVVAAYKVSSQNVAVIAEQLTLAGLTNAAFGEAKSATTMTPGSSGWDNSPGAGGDDYFSRLKRRETRRIRISGTEFRVWV